MTQHEGRRLRLLRAQRPPVLPASEPAAEPIAETAETLLPDVPRVGALDALLREVDSLRLTLETDLTLAAAAVESGAVHVAADIIDSERDGLKAFEKRALGHVAELSAPRKRRVRVPAAPFVAAAAVAGFLLGVVPHTAAPTQNDAISAQNSSASQSLQTLEAAASSGQTAEAIAAANQLHLQITTQVLANAASDPKAARQALELLDKEQQVLLLAGDSAALNQVIAASKQLSTTLLNVLHAPVKAPSRTTQVQAPPVVPATTPQPTKSPSSKPTTTSSPKPTTTTSPSPKASSSPSSSGAPNGPGGLPGTPH